MDFLAELDVAREAARAGAEAAARRFRGSFERSRKADATWVTEADTEAEAAVRAVLAEAFPGHNVLGEEEGLREVSAGAPTWVVDPVDGTANFVAGIPIWATLVALVVDGRSVVGVAHAPALGEVYEAAAGGGARLNGEPIRVEPVGSLAEATVLYGGGRHFDPPALARLLAGAGRDRGLGDFWGHLLVARGAAHVMVEAAPLSLWDVAALQPIVAEAGGRLTGLDGSRWEPGFGCLTSCGPLYDEVAALLRD